MNRIELIEKLAKEIAATGEQSVPVLIALLSENSPLTRYFDEQDALLDTAEGFLDGFIDTAVTPQKAHESQFFSTKADNAWSALKIRREREGRKAPPRATYY